MQPLASPIDAPPFRNTMLHFEIWGKMPSGYYCQSWGKLCADLQNPTAYLLAAQLIP